MTTKPAGPPPPPRSTAQLIFPDADLSSYEPHPTELNFGEQNPCFPFMKAILQVLKSLKQII